MIRNRLKLFPGKTGFISHKKLVYRDLSHQESL